jgi:hypothetical protein
MNTRLTNKKSLLTAAIAATISAVSASASADLITGSWTGLFTTLAPNGAVTANTDINDCVAPYLQVFSCTRTSIAGTLTFDTATGSGAGTVVPFSFLGSGLASATTISFQAIGDGAGGPGSLVLGNMGFNWNANNGIPVSIVLDAAGFFGAAHLGVTASQTVTGGATPESDNTTGAGAIGPAVLATTDWNTTTIPGATLGTNPSGTLPLITDVIVDITNGDVGIGGTPMPAGPFPGFNFNFDITSVHIDSCVETGNNPGGDPTAGCAAGPVVPVPAAFWLFGTGLAGLAGAARRWRKG